MNKFWADMLLEGKAKFSDIKGESRRKGVKEVLDRYLREGTIDQETYDNIFEEE